MQDSNVCTELYPTEKTPRLHLKLLGLVLFQMPENFSMRFLKYAIWLF